LANDDGIYAPGLHALRQTLERLGNVLVVAPATEQSGVGHSITYLTPLTCKELWEDEFFRGWAVDGSPADCVKLGVSELSKEPIDLVVSGINGGLNAGINVHNINIPTAATQSYRKGIYPEVHCVPMGVERYGDHYIKRQDPKGRNYYWSTNDPPPRPTDHETDLNALAAGHVTLTPLQFDMTKHALLNEMQSWGVKLGSK